MLSARAYSFRMQSRLAISLSWVGGFVNVVGWMTFATGVSHASGNITHFGQGLLEAITERRFHGAIFFGFVLLCFLLGAASSGLMTELARRRGMQSKYILPMASEAVLLSVFAVLIAVQARDANLGPAMVYAMSGVACMAMGLQNATITKISGAVVRTTHVTGVITDLGLEGVQLLLWYRDKLRSGRSGRTARVLAVTRRHPTTLRIALLASICGSFLLGVIVGAFLYARVPQYAMILPVSFLLYIVLVDYFTPIAAVSQIDPLADLEIGQLGDLRGVLPAGVGIYRLSHHRRNAVHRSPDFQAWADRLPRSWRVVILAISPLTHLDSDAVANLRAAILSLRDHGCGLILGGVTPAQFRTLRDANFFDTVQRENVCTDMEFAIARAIDSVR
ncbi:hypothetical protein BH09PLA1_BH09PLA1_06370 [soil metagenome]